MSGDAPMEDLRQLVATSPFYRWTGMRVADAHPGAVALVLDLEERHTNIQGFAHGGVLATLADAAMGLSVRSALEPGRRHVTIELGMHYLRAVTRGAVTARGGVVRVGREIGYAEADVVDEVGRMIARASGTYSVTRPRD